MFQRRRKRLTDRAREASDQRDAGNGAARIAAIHPHERGEVGSVERPNYGAFTYFDFPLILRGRVSNRCRMRSPLHSDKYQLFLEELNTLRADAGLSQTELAARMQIGQDVVSRCEAGRRRVDVFELALWTHACGTTLEAFVKKLDERIQRHQLPSLL